MQSVFFGDLNLFYASAINGLLAIGKKPIKEILCHKRNFISAVALNDLFCFFVFPSFKAGYGKINSIILLLLQFCRC
jgi:hypothetical protein